MCQPRGSLPFYDDSLYLWSLLGETERASLTDRRAVEAAGEGRIHQNPASAAAAGEEEVVEQAYRRRMADNSEISLEPVDVRSREVLLQAPNVHKA